MIRELVCYDPWLLQTARLFSSVLAIPHDYTSPEMNLLIRVRRNDYSRIKDFILSHIEYTAKGALFFFMQSKDCEKLRLVAKILTN